MVNYILESIVENLLTSFSSAREISAKINLFQAIQLVTDSWRAIKTNTIQNCFAACGLKRLEIPKTSSDTENEDVLQVPIVNYRIFDNR